MRTEPETGYAPEISKKERGILNEVLRRYGFSAVSVKKVRSAYKVCTEKGDFCLKRVSHGYAKAKKSYYLVKHLKENGCDNLADYYPTKDGKELLEYKGDAFYLTNWIDGREVSFSNADEILRCTGPLANFHNQAKGFKTPKHVKMKSHTKKWIKSYRKYIEEIEGFKKHIDRLKLKSEFDYKYRDSIDLFLEVTELAVQILENSSYNDVCEYYSSEGYVCHDSFYYQNILLGREEKLYIVDMESCQYDIPVSDLGKLLRRVLTKKHFRWDFDFCRRIIEEYCKVRPLAKEEYEMLLSLLIFPHKFWRLGRKRYIRNKKWSEDKYKKKLRRLLRERQLKREFIHCYIKFYGLKIDYNPDIVDRLSTDKFTEY